MKGHRAFGTGNPSGPDIGHHQWVKRPRTSFVFGWGNVLATKARRVGIDRFAITIVYWIRLDTIRGRDMPQPLALGLLAHLVLTLLAAGRFLRSLLFGILALPVI